MQTEDRGTLSEVPTDRHCFLKYSENWLGGGGGYWRMLTKYWQQGAQTEILSEKEGILTKILSDRFEQTTVRWITDRMNESAFFCERQEFLVHQLSCQTIQVPQQHVYLSIVLQRCIFVMGKRFLKLTLSTLLLFCSLATSSDIKLILITALGFAVTRGKLFSQQYLTWFPSRVWANRRRISNKNTIPL